MEALAQAANEWLGRTRVWVVNAASDWLTAAVRNLLQNNAAVITAIVASLVLAVLLDAFRKQLFGLMRQGAEALVVLVVGALRLGVRFAVAGGFAYVLYPYLLALATTLFERATLSCADYVEVAAQHRLVWDGIARDGRLPTAAEERAIAVLEQTMAALQALCERAK